MRISNERYYEDDNISIGNNGIVDDFYFNLGPLIVSKVNGLKFFKKNIDSAPVFWIQYFFNKDNFSFSEPDYIENIFSSRLLTFMLTIEERNQLRGTIIKPLKNRYDSFEEIIPDVVEVVRFIENRLESSLLSYYLVKQGE